jgi:anti-sigma factor RsiW
MNHPKIAELLPWYVNGTLGLGDRQAAALEVASCDECAKDVEEFTKVQAAMLELEAEAPEPNEYAFARALSAVEEEEKKKRLGHPWTGWWWALTPFRRATVVSSDPTRIAE